MTKTIAHPVIYHHGMDAFDAGRSLKDNPYPDDAAKHESWKLGWLQGFRIAQHDREEYEQEKQT